MTISLRGFKTISLAVIAALCLAESAAAPAFGTIRVQPNAGVAPGQPGTLRQEAEDTENAAVDAEESESLPDDESVADESPADESPADETSADETSADDSSADEAAETEASDDSGESEAA